MSTASLCVFLIFSANYSSGIQLTLLQQHLLKRIFLPLETGSLIT